jgi:hypothetical protein
MLAKVPVVHGVPVEARAREQWQCKEGSGARSKKAHVLKTRARACPRTHTCDHVPAHACTRARARPRTNRPSPRCRCSSYPHRTGRRSGRLWPSPAAWARRSCRPRRSPTPCTRSRPQLARRSRPRTLCMQPMWTLTPRRRTHPRGTQCSLSVHLSWCMCLQGTPCTRQTCCQRPRRRTGPQCTQCTRTRRSGRCRRPPHKWYTPQT